MLEGERGRFLIGGANFGKSHGKAVASSEEEVPAAARWIADFEIEQCNFSFVVGKFVNGVGDNGFEGCI